MRLNYQPVSTEMLLNYLSLYPNCGIFKW